MYISRSLGYNRSELGALYRFAFEPCTMTRHFAAHARSAMSMEIVLPPKKWNVYVLLAQLHEAYAKYCVMLLPLFADVCVHIYPPCLVVDYIVVLARTCTGYQPRSRKPADLLCACPLFDCANRGDSHKRVRRQVPSHLLVCVCSSLPSQSCLLRTVAWSYHLVC